MHDAFFVRRIECIRQLDSYLHGPRNRAFPRRQHPVQRLALQQFHGDEGDLFMLFDGINRAYPGMVQSRCRTRFSQKPLQRLPVAAGLFSKELQRYTAPQAAIFRLVHHAHAAAANFSQHLVMGNGLVNHSFLRSRC